MWLLFSADIVQEPIISGIIAATIDETVIEFSTWWLLLVEINYLALCSVMSFIRWRISISNMNLPISFTKDILISNRVSSSKSNIVVLNFLAYHILSIPIYTIWDSMWFICQILLAIIDLFCNNFSKPTIANFVIPLRILSLWCIIIIFSLDDDDVRDAWPIRKCVF